MHARRTILSKEIVMDSARSATCIFKDLLVGNWINTDGTITWGGKTIGMPPILNTPVRIVAGNLVSPTSTGSQDIGSPRGSIGTKEVRDTQPLETSINVIYAEHRDPAPTWSKVIGREISDESIAKVYSRFWINLMRDAVLTKIPKFMNMGISSVHTLDELGSVFIPNTRIGRLTDVSSWLPPGQSYWRSYSGYSEQDGIREKI